MQQCATCSAFAPDKAETCLACGAPFSLTAATAQTSERGAVQHNPPVHHEGYSWVVYTGAALMIFGAILAAIGLFSSGAPEYSDTLNIGLLNEKTNLVTAGGFAFTSGSVFVATAAILHRLSKSLAVSRLPSSETTAGELSDAQRE